LIPPGARAAASAWFTRIGSPLSATDAAQARDYLSALGYPETLPIEHVSRWPDAERVVRDPEWDTAWWRGEQQERDRLMVEVRRRLGVRSAIERLTAATELTADAIHAAALAAAAQAVTDVADAALIRAAAGSATMALHEVALARLAGCGPDHVFVRKYRLFESGRWPLGVLRGAFHLF
jgi:hypothetical protein